jgi:hypothetical protein
LAERVIPEAMREELVKGYYRAEALTDADFTEHYRELVESYEQEQ